MKFNEPQASLTPDTPWRLVAQEDCSAPATSSHSCEKLVRTSKIQAEPAQVRLQPRHHERHLARFW